MKTENLQLQSQTIIFNVFLILGNSMSLIIYDLQELHFYSLKNAVIAIKLKKHIHSMLLICKTNHFVIELTISHSSYLLLLIHRVMYPTSSCQVFLCCYIGREIWKYRGDNNSICSLILKYLSINLLF